MAHTVPLSSHIRPILASIQTVPIPPRPDAPRVQTAPFVTISREPGAGGLTLGRQLVAALNAREALEPEPRAWTCWDRELVERVADDPVIARELADSLEEKNHSWLSDFFTGLSLDDKASRMDEARLFRRMATTMRALAQAGRVVLVGRGGVFVTRQMPGGIHVRLVAPLEHRIQTFMRDLGMTHERAATHLRTLEHNRQAFLQRYFSVRHPEVEQFTLTLNTARIDPQVMIRMLMTLVNREEP